MKEQSPIEEQVSAIRKLIKDNKLKEALQELEMLPATSEEEKSNLLLWRKYQGIEKDFQIGIIGIDEKNVRLSVVAKKILDRLDRHLRQQLPQTEQEQLQVLRNEPVFPNFVVGLDLGDGESSIAFQPIKKSAAPALFEIAAGKTRIVTALATSASDRRQLLIGEEALKHEVFEFQINFKFKPGPAGNWHDGSGRHIRDFVRKFFHTFLASPQGLDFFPENYVVYVGCPSAWNKEAIQIYENYLSRKVDGIESCRVVSESFVALLNAKENEQLNLEELDASLVIDIGSSTTDFTFISRDSDTGQLVSRNIDLSDEVGEDLGARKIDQAIYNWSIAQLGNNPAKEMLGFASSKAYWKYLCRKAKEAAFNGQRIADPLKHFDGYSNPDLVEQCWEIIGALTVDKILNLDIGSGIPMTWSGSYRGFLNLAKRKLPQIPKAVLLTGGGSKMPFTHQIAREVFPAPSKVIVDETPQLSVVKGLTIYGKYDYFELTKQEIKQFLDNERAKSALIGYTEKFLLENDRELFQVLLNNVFIPLVEKLQANFEDVERLVKVALIQEEELFGFKRSKNAPSLDSDTLGIPFLLLLFETLFDNNLPVENMVNRFTESLMRNIQSEESPAFEKYKRIAKLDFVDRLQRDRGSALIELSSDFNEEFQDFFSREENLRFHKALSYLHNFCTHDFDHLSLTDVVKAIQEKEEEENGLENKLGIFAANALSFLVRGGYMKGIAKALSLSAPLLKGTVQLFFKRKYDEFIRDFVEESLLELIESTIEIEWLEAAGVPDFEDNLIKTIYHSFRLWLEKGPEE